MEQPIRVAVFSDSALPIINGVSVSVDALIKELRSRGHKADLYANRYPKYRETDPDTFRFFSLELPFWKGYPLTMPPLDPVLAEFRKRKYDLVHTHTPFLVGMVGLRWSESHDLPIVSTYHTLYDRYAHYVKVLPPRFIRYRIARHTNYYYQRVQHVITPSEASLRWLRRHDVQTPATIIPTGSPLPRAIPRAEARKELQVGDQDLVLLYVGRLAPEKNLPLLFEAVAKIMRRNERVQFWLVGDGPFRPSAEAIAAKYEMQNRTRFIGFISPTEIGRYYAAADIFTFASVTETQGLVVQEAMLHRLPVAAVAGGGASESILPNQNAILCRNEAEDLAAGILQLIEDPSLRARIADTGFNSQLAHTVPAMVDRIVNVYRRTLSERVTSITT